MTGFLTKSERGEREKLKSRTAEILYYQMLLTTPEEIAKTAYKAINAIQKENVSNQILGIGAILVMLLDKYGLSHTDVLGIADNMVFSDDNNNLSQAFYGLKRYMKDEWRI